MLGTLYEKKRKGLTIFLFSLPLAPVADAAVLLGVTALAVGVLALGDLDLPLLFELEPPPWPGRALVSFLASIWRLSPVSRALSSLFSLKISNSMCKAQLWRRVTWVALIALALTMTRIKIGTRQWNP